MTRDPEITQLDTAEDSSEPELFCPECDYSLKGLPHDVCPECGKPFDRQLLTTWAMGENIPLRLWLPGRPDRPWIALFWLSLFSPGRLGKLLPPRPDLSELSRFGMAMRFACILFAVSVALTDHTYIIVFLMLLIPLVFISSCCCEWLLAFLLNRMTAPRAVRHLDSAHFWRAFCYCHSSFLIISLVLLAGMIFLDIDHVLNVVIPAFSFFWWWYTLGQNIRVRTIPSAGRAIVLLLVPLVAAVSVLIGGLIATMIAETIINLF